MPICAVSGAGYGKGELERHVIAVMRRNCWLFVD